VEAARGRKAGQALKKVLHDGGDGGVAPGRPLPCLAVDGLVDTDGDVFAHGWFLQRRWDLAQADLRALLYVDCAPGEGYFVQEEDIAACRLWSGEKGASSY
jgi:hypothetical protein